MTKNELTKLTKDELIKLAKKRFALKLDKADLKNDLINSTLKAFKKSAKKKISPKPASAKKTPTARTVTKVTTKKSASKSVVAKKTTNKVAAKKATPKKLATKNRTKKVIISKSATVSKPTTKAATKKITPKITTAKKSANKPAAKLASPKPLAVKKAVTKETVKKVATPKGTLARHQQLDAEETISDSKYHLADTQGELYTDNGIPHSFMDDRVFLFVRDPFWIFASWDLKPETPANIAEAHGIDINKSKIVLRVYDVTDINFDGSNSHKWFDIDSNSIHGGFHIEVPEGDRSYLIEIGVRDNLGNFGVIARSNSIATPRSGVSPRTDSQWMVADEDFWKMYALSGGFQPDISSSEMEGEMCELLMKSLSSGGGSGIGSSSEAVPRRSEDDNFPFKLDCELIVYGQTRPSAEVTLKGEKVNLRPDGTFTVRFALPDGLQVIEAEAVSENKRYTINITPTISRSTASFTNSDNAKIGGEDVL